MNDSAERWAERRDGLVVRMPIRTDGIERALYKSRIETRRWRPVRRGVAAINGSPPTWRQSVRAAVLAAGPDAFASHFTALELWSVSIRGLSSDVIHLSAGAGRKIRMAGVVGHRFHGLEPGDVTSRWEIPAATPIKVVIDLSSNASDSQLGQLIDEFLRRRQLDLTALRARVDRLRPAPGRSVARLRRVLAGRPGGYEPGDSELEGRILRLLAEHGFPRPVSQFWVRRSSWKARIDQAYPEVMLYIECDGFGYHHATSDLDHDSRRRNHLVTDGWRPLTFTWRMTDEEIIGTMAAVFDRQTGEWRCLPTA